MPQKVVVEVSDGESDVQEVPRAAAGGNWLQQRGPATAMRARTKPTTFPVAKKIEIVEAWLVYSNSPDRKKGGLSQEDWLKEHFPPPHGPKNHSTLIKWRNNLSQLHQQLETSPKAKTLHQRVAQREDVVQGVNKWFIEERLAGRAVKKSGVIAKIKELKDPNDLTSNSFIYREWREQNDIGVRKKTDKRTVSEALYAEIQAFRTTFETRWDVLRGNGLINWFNVDETPMYYAKEGQVTLEIRGTKHPRSWRFCRWNSCKACLDFSCNEAQSGGSRAQHSGMHDFPAGKGLERRGNLHEDLANLVR